MKSSLPIRTGFIGLGLAGNAHWYQASMTDELEIVAACRRDADELEEYCEIRGIAERYRDSSALLQNAKLDAVVISTPHNVIGAHVEAAMRSGCTVILAEKPLGASVADIRKLSLAATSSAAKLVIAYPRRYLNHYKQAAEWLREKRIGTLKGVLCEWLGPYESRYSSTPAHPTFRTDPVQATHGVLLDSGCHLLDAIMWLTQEDIVEINAIFEPAIPKIETAAALVGRLAGGALLTANIVPTPVSPQRGIIFIGTSGRVELDDHSARLEAGSDVQLIKHAPGMDGPIPDIIRVCGGHPQTGCNLFEASKVIKVIEAAYTAATRGGPTRIDHNGFQDE